MSQHVATDALDDRALIVAPDLPVDELARKIDEARVPGAVVVEHDQVVGVVTEMDLVFRNKRLHMPTMFAIWEAVVQLDPGGRAKAELAKATGATVREVMSTDVVRATPTTPLADIASWMVDDNLSLVPVLDGSRLIGVVTRRSMMHAAFRR